jgi:biopolymer transport protein TolQ
MNQDLSILHLVLNASLVVQLVMLLLVAISITSWAAIFRKLFSLGKVKALNETFERNFWSGTSLNDLFAAASQNALAARWSAFLPAACASTKSCESAASPTPPP